MKRVAILYAATKGALIDVPSLTRSKECWEIGLYRFLETERPAILTELAEEQGAH